MAELARFLHPNGRITRLPIHFKDAKIGQHLVLLDDEVEEDKVVLPNVANSQLRVGHKLRETPDVKPDIEDEE